MNEGMGLFADVPRTKFPAFFNVKCVYDSPAAGGPSKW